MNLDSRRRKKSSGGIKNDQNEYALRAVYDPIGFRIQNIRLEAESREYGAADFELNDFRIKFRVAKITPTKIGQFVTFWKRIGKGPISPFDIDDAFDFLVVSVKDGERSGQFVFPKLVLAEQGIISKRGAGGKRAMRVYPLWGKADNPQAKKTQAWQLQYFFEINEQMDLARVRSLFG